MEAVAGVARGVDRQFDAAGFLDLAAQTAHLGVEAPLVVVQQVLVEGLDDLLAADQFAGVAHQGVQHDQVLFGERQRAAAGDVQAARPGFQAPRRRRAGRQDAPAQGGEGGGQFVQVAVLAQVVVGAVAEAGDLVAQGVARGEHHDAQRLLLATQIADQLQAVAVGQAEVDDGEAMARGDEAGAELRQAGHGVDPVAAAGEEVGEFLAQDRLVFEKDEIGHGRQGTPIAAGQTERF